MCCPCDCHNMTHRQHIQARADWLRCNKGLISVAFLEGAAMFTNDSVILEKLPDPVAVRERLSELTAERNLLKGLLRLFEQQGFREADRRRKQGERQTAVTA